MSKLIPVSFLKKADYQNADGSFTRFPDQIWIDKDITKQSAEHVLVLQYKDVIEKVSEMIKDTRKELKKKKSIVEVDSLLESIYWFINHNAT